MEIRKDLSARSIATTIAILATSTLVGFFFTWIHVNNMNIILLYIVGVVLVAMKTGGRAYCMIASFVSVVCFNFFFAEPVFSLVARADYFATFAVMLFVSFLISSLTISVKTTSEKAVRMEERAKQEALRSNLLRSISHDLRTPLTGISGNASMLKKHGPELSESIRQEIYNSIDEDSNWLINLVENLLLVTRLNDQVALNLQPLPVREIVDEAMQHIDHNSARHNITVNYADELLIIMADERCMIQVIINIINNAIKHTPDDSNISVEIFRQDNDVVIRFCDNGPGISDAAKQKLFDMFYTEGKLHSDSRRGLGLGLYLCKSIIDAHGGSIAVLDNEPQGTVFECRLPAVEAEHLSQMEDH